MNCRSATGCGCDANWPSCTRGSRVLLGLLAGGAYGAWRAKTVEMTKMPELVAFFHRMIGLAAVFMRRAAPRRAAPHCTATTRARQFFLS